MSKDTLPVTKRLHPFSMDTPTGMVSHLPLQCESGPSHSSSRSLLHVFSQYLAPRTKQHNTQMSTKSDTSRRGSDAESDGTAFTVQNRGSTSSRRSSQDSGKTGVDVLSDDEYQREWGESDRHQQDKAQAQAPGIDEILNTSLEALYAKGCTIGRGPTKLGHVPSKNPATDALHFKLEAFKGEGETATPSRERTMSGITEPSQLSFGNESTGAASLYVPPSSHHPTSPMLAANAQSTQDGREGTSGSHLDISDRPRHYC